MRNYGGPILESGAEGQKFVFSIDSLGQDFVIEHYTDGKRSGVIATVPKGTAEHLVLTYNEDSGYLTVFDYPGTKKIKLKPDAQNPASGGSSKFTSRGQIADGRIFFEKEFTFTPSKERGEIRVSHAFKAKLRK